jgi:hypothetical protein
MTVALTQRIEKELISGCTFLNVRNDISSEARKLNDKKLFRAMLLGNGFHNKVKIFFTTTEGERMVETTVWAFTERFVMLKGNVFIPVEAITNVALD